MRRARTWTILLLSVGLTSCGDEDGRVPVYPVTGTLTINGQPAEGVSLRLFATDLNNSAPRPSAITKAGGKLVISTYNTGDGAPAGEYKVTVQWPTRVQAFGRVENGPDRLGGKYAEQANAPLTLTVEEGPTNVGTLDLKAEVREVKVGRVAPKDGNR